MQSSSFDWESWKIGRINNLYDINFQQQKYALISLWSVNVVAFVSFPSFDANFAYFSISIFLYEQKSNNNTIARIFSPTFISFKIHKKWIIYTRNTFIVT